MPESIVSIKGQVTKINPTDKVISDEVSPCPGCGDTSYENRAIHPWGFCGSEIYCLKCGKVLGQIGG
jgi:hypothetical protein